MKFPSGLKVLPKNMPTKNIWCKNVPSRCGPFGHLCQTFAPPMGLLEGVTPAKFSFTNTSSLHGVCSDGSLVGNRESGEGVNDFGRKLSLISFVYGHELSFSILVSDLLLCVLSMFNTFWHHFKFSILQVFRCHLFQLHHLYAYAPFNFTFPLELHSSI